MKILKYGILILCSPLMLFGQQPVQRQNFVSSIQSLEQQPAIASFEQNAITVTNESTIEAQLIRYLVQSIPQLQAAETSLQLSHQRTSRIGKHYSFKQTYKGIPIFGASVQLNVNPNNIVLSTFNNCVNTVQWDANEFSPKQHMGIPYWFVVADKPMPGYSKFEGEHQTLVDENGTLLYQKEAKFNYMQDDTNATGKVFLPDPLTSQSVIYGQDGTYQHFNDSDYALLNNQRKDVVFPVTYENDSFRLKNKYVTIVDREAPLIRPAVSKSASFDFLRSRSGFKDLMVLYHVFATQEYFQYLGFDELANYQIKADAHSGTGDQSAFLFGADSSINFGTGGVPDAEDADVIMHEYTHALSWFINPAPNMASERRAIEEGICDVISAVQSKKYTEYNWRRIFNFDGPNPVAPGFTSFWNGRNGNSTRTYPERTNNPYQDCQIWTSTILDITNEIGSDSAVILMLESIYSMSENTTMPQAATLFMQADSILFSKYFSWKIGRLFNERGLGNFKTSVAEYQSLKQFVSLKNTEAFFNGEGDAVLDLGPINNAVVEIFDANGKKVYSQMVKDTTLAIENAGFTSGLYVVRITAPEGIISLKLMKASK